MTKEIIKRAKKKIKKVMLIYPPIKISRYSNRPCFSPLGILYIAAVLRGAGYDVKVLDAVVEDYNHQEKIDNRFIYYGMPFERIKQKRKTQTEEICYMKKKELQACSISLFIITVILFLFIYVFIIIYHYLLFFIFVYYYFFIIIFLFFYILNI